MFDTDYEQIHVFRDPAAGCTGAIVVHSTRLGPAFGGIRRMAYGSVAEAVADAQRLASAMTWKCAIAGVPGGGAKAVLVDHDGLDREAAYRRLGREVERLAGDYYTGPDVGTTADDLRAVARETRFVARPDAEGPGDLAAPTALGVFAGIEAVAAQLGASLGGLAVAVQGLGAVGLRLVERLCAAGAVVTVADVDPDRVALAVERHGAAAVAVEAITAVPCDVFAPCALGGVVDADTAASLPARAIAGSANNVLADAAAGRALHARGVLYAPDFVINAGALIHGAWFHLEGRVPEPTRVTALGGILTEVFHRSAERDEPTETAARWLARQRAGLADIP